MVALGGSLNMLLHTWTFSVWVCILNMLSPSSQWSDDGISVDHQEKMNFAQPALPQEISDKKIERHIIEDVGPITQETAEPPVVPGSPGGNFANFPHVTFWLLFSIMAI